MKTDYKTYGHLKERIEEYLGHIEELDDYSYAELAEAFNTNHVSTITLLSGEKYREVSLNGINYGLGYTVEGDTAYIRTIVSPLDVEGAVTGVHPVTGQRFVCKRELA